MDIIDLELEAALRKARKTEQKSVPTWWGIREKIFMKAYIECEGRSVAMAAKLGM